MEKITIQKEKIYIKELDKNFNKSVRIISNQINQPATSKVTSYLLTTYLTVLIAKYIENKIEHSVENKITECLSRTFHKQ